jgi:hypothetical protein
MEMSVLEQYSTLQYCRTERALQLNGIQDYLRKDKTHSKVWDLLLHFAVVCQHFLLPFVQPDDGY